MAFTDRGRDIIENLQNVTLIEHPFDVVAEGQMKKNAHHKEVSFVNMYLLSHGYPITSAVFKFTMFCQRVISKLKKIL